MIATKAIRTVAIDACNQLVTIERDPEKRYATAKEMASDLEEVLRQNKYGGKNEVTASFESFDPPRDASMRPTPSTTCCSPSSCAASGATACWTASTSWPT